MVERAVSIVENADAIPELGVLLGARRGERGERRVKERDAPIKSHGCSLAILGLWIIDDAVGGGDRGRRGRGDDGGAVGEGGCVGGGGVAGSGRGGSGSVLWLSWRRDMGGKDIKDGGEEIFRRIRDQSNHDNRND
jgi:hypothetical protein